MDELKTPPQLNLDALEDHPQPQPNVEQREPMDKKEAARARCRAYYLRNREKVLAKSREYAKANREKRRLNRREWSRRNPHKERIYRQRRKDRDPVGFNEKQRIKQREWREKNRERVRLNDRRHRLKGGFKEKNAAKMRAYRAKNPERMRQYAKLQRLKPSSQIARRKSHIKRKAAIRGATIKPESIGEFITRIKAKKRIRCYYCRNWIATPGIHFDHVIAVSKNGTHEVGNLCVACPPCNVHKSNHSIEHWNKISNMNQPLLPI